MSAAIVKRTWVVDATDNSASRYAPAEWSWSPTAPVLVVLRSTPFGRPAREWTLARSLLSEALSVEPPRLVGEGDVLVHRTWAGHLSLHLSGVLLIGAADAAAVFLDETCRVCAPCVCSDPELGAGWCRECAATAGAVDAALVEILKEAA